MREELTKDSAIACTEGDAGENGHDPVDVGCACPSKPDLANSEKHSAKRNHTDHGLWRRLSRLRILLMLINPPPDQRLTRNRHQRPCANTAEGQPGYSRRPAAYVFEDDGVCHEAEV